VTDLRRYREPVLTWANVVTALRTLVCVGLFAAAAVRHSARLNLIGLGIYWILDILDGYLARRLNQETRLGAQFDILSDRLLVVFFYTNHLAWHHQLVVPIALFLVQFMLVDQFLSNQFLQWSIRSPNYFYLVEPMIWRLNWSPLAKASNTGLATLLLLLAGSPWWSALASSALIVIKIYSLVRLLRLPLPEPLPR
jgi:CDP-diacylglycerol--glycerol-3-phosphate 3-phosphatidyltransferase